MDKVLRIRSYSRFNFTLKKEKKEEPAMMKNANLKPKHKKFQGDKKGNFI